MWASVFSAIFDGLLSLIGLSRKKPDEQIGELRAENKDLKADLEAKKHEIEVMGQPDKPYGDVLGMFDKRP